MTDRPWVGVSPCLIGVAVRYDGAEKRQRAVLELGPIVHWVPVCPESGASLGTPREPARLVGGAGSPRFVTWESARDQTEQLRLFIDEALPRLPWSRLAGWVLKARSPSCGWGTTPRFSDEYVPEPEWKGNGLWTEALHRYEPDLPLIDEEGLLEPVTRSLWLERVGQRDRLLRST